jgi:hypothetical protein
MAPDNSSSSEQSTPVPAAMPDFVQIGLADAEKRWEDERTDTDRAALWLADRCEALEREQSDLFVTIGSLRARLDAAERDTARLDWLAQWGSVSAGSAWDVEGDASTGLFEWCNPGSWTMYEMIPGSDGDAEQVQYVECDIPLREAIDAARTASPSPEPQR